MPRAEGKQVAPGYTSPTNYTATSTNLDGHLQGIDNALGGAGGSLAGIPGVLYEDCEFYADAGDRNSYPGSGVAVSDLVASQDGTLDGAYADGHFQFDGTTEEIDFGTLAAALVDLFGTGGTLSVWCRPYSDGGGNAGQVLSTADSADTKGWFLRVENESVGLVRYAFQQNRATTDTFYNTFRTFPIYQWHHVVITYDASAPATKFPTIYIDGQLITPDTQTAGSGAVASDTGQKLIAGNRAAADRGFDGDVDQVLLWDRVLSAQEVRQLYGVTQDRFRPSLVGLDAPSATATAQPVEMLGGAGGTTSGDGATVRGKGGPTTGSGDAGAMDMKGGDYKGSSGTATGGDGFFGGGDNETGTGRAGDGWFTGGDKGTAAGDAGTAYLRGGSKSGSSTGDVGGVDVRTGSGSSACSGAEMRFEVTALTTPNPVGHMVFQAGDNNGSGLPGDLVFYGSDAVSQDAGEIRFIGGSTTGGGRFGTHIRFTTGGSSNYYTGWMYFDTAAQTSGTRGSGSIQVKVGNTFGNFSSNVAGSYSVEGSHHTSTSGSASAGSVTHTAGYSNSNDNASDGGDVASLAGDQNGTGTASPGNNRIVAGSKTAGNATGGISSLEGGDGNGTGNGGHCSAIPGNGGTGNDGYFEVRTKSTATAKGWRSYEIDKVQTTTNTATSILTVGTLSAAGENLIVEVHFTGQGDSATGEALQSVITTGYYRDSTIQEWTPRAINDHNFVGAGTTLVCNLVISGNNILLQVTGQLGVTINWSGIVRVKKGGK